MKFSLTTQFKNPLDTFKIARYNILTEYKNALIGISTCAAVVQREGKNGGESHPPFTVRVFPQWHGRHPGAFLLKRKILMILWQRHRRIFCE